MGSFPETYNDLKGEIVDISQATTAVFSLNFSSAGKGPFMDGKGKNIYFSKRGAGEEAVE